MLFKTCRFLFILLLLQPLIIVARENKISFETKPNYIPILKNNDQNPVVRIEIESEVKTSLNEIKIDFDGSTEINDIKGLELYTTGEDTVFKPNNRAASIRDIIGNVTLNPSMVIAKGKTNLWISIQLHRESNLLNMLHCRVVGLILENGVAMNAAKQQSYQFRYGYALRKFGQDGVHTSRIPGLATAEDGTLLAIYDARRELGRDLQGDIDIGLNRSFDNGDTWEPMQVIMDKGEWGGLPEKFNGVSDACILVNGEDIYVAGLWMYGVIDKHGVWQENLDEESEDWNHQWRTKGSQPGYGVKQTSQFLIVKSADSGATWSEPLNLTKMCKKEEWWLWAPAPGHGIVMDDGTLVFPTQGRDAEGLPFSNITYSNDNGKTWKTSNPASHNTTECSVVELDNGLLMLNIRDNRNRKDKSDTNGRAVYTTDNLGESWNEHPTSHGALIEPVCMASLHKHSFMFNGKKEHFLVFSNPNSKFQRNNQTIKLSMDNGMSWPEEDWILLDEGKGRGYSSIASINDSTIGIIYEASRAHIVYQMIDLSRYLSKNFTNR